MPDYRIYRMDPNTGRIQGVEEAHFSDDVAAIHALQQRRFDVPVELWEGARKLTRLDGPAQIPDRAERRANSR